MNKEEVIRHMVEFVTETEKQIHEEDLKINASKTKQNAVNQIISEIKKVMRDEDSRD